MAQNLNQFKQTAERGQIALLCANSPVISAVVDSTEAGTLKAGDAVKLVSTSKDCPHVVKVANSDTACTGFVVFNPVKNDGIAAGDRVEIAITGAFMYMVASAAILAGASVDYAYNTGKVATSNSGLACGVALDAAAADGDLIRVAVKANI
jgi:predicted RecA/RadA family phage recombinase